MNRLERYLVIATNLSILVGLLLVVFQLRQNRDAIELQLQMSIAEVLSQTDMAVATSRDLALLMSKASADNASDFDEADRIQVSNWLAAALEPRISYYFLKDSNIIANDDWCNAMRFVESAYAKPYYRKIMESNYAYLDSMLRDIRAICHREGAA